MVVELFRRRSSTSPAVRLVEGWSARGLGEHKRLNPFEDDSIALAYKVDLLNNAGGALSCERDISFAEKMHSSFNTATSQLAVAAVALCSVGVLGKPLRIDGGFQFTLLGLVA